MSNTLKTLWNAFGRYRWHVAALVLFGILSPLIEGIGINAVIPLMSFFMGGAGQATDVITQTIQSLFTFFHIPFTFRYLLGFILALFVVRAIFVVVFGYIRGWITADFLSKESEEVMRLTLLSSWSFSLRQKIGTMQNTLVRDVQQTGGLLGTVVQVIQSFSGFIMYFLVAIDISPTMTFYTLGGGAVLIFFLRPLLRRSRRIGQEAANVEKQFAQFLTEHIIGMKSIKAAGVERAAIDNGATHIDRLRKLSIRQALVNTLGSSFFQPFAIVLVVLLFLLTYHAPGFNIVSFAAGLYLIQKIFTYLESGQNSLQTVSALLPYAKNIDTFKRSLAEHKESAKGDSPFVFKKELTFKDVSFSYDEGKSVLDGVTFSIHSGETVGLVGPSGSGKTSVADILLRLFTPKSGGLLLDEVPGDLIGLEKWRKSIGYVSQDVFLLNDTIEENIRFYNRALTAQDIEQAAKQANIYDFIMSLPEGFETTTGDRGVMLSGGQRQRIALARALAGKPSLLILDEATSALDHESEKLIHESIKALHGTMTVFIIAHRPSTVAEADTIIVLNCGRVVEQGTPQQLLQKHDSYFFKMQHA
jgi:ABC-type multidrug transport system fused ATPase/permease subunit